MTAENEETGISAVYETVTYEHSVQELVEFARRNADYCCQDGCGSGACETCPCCVAGVCMAGHEGLPEDAEGLAWWLEVASEHNPVAAALRDRIAEGVSA